MVDRKYELGHEKISTLLVRYSTPTMFAMLANSLYNLADTIFVGQGVGTLALAGLAVSFPIHMVILAVGLTVGTGSASIISRSLGAGDQRRAERAAGTSFVTVVALSLAVTVMGLLFLQPLLRLFGAREAVLPYASDYLSVALLGGPLFGFAVSSNSVARAEGNVKVAMFCMLLGAGVNIVLDPVFIFALDMGIRGAAVATVIGNFCAFAFLCAYFLSGKSMLRIRREDLRFDFTVLPEIFKIGGASFVRMLAGSLMALIINNSVVHYGADVHLAVLGIANRAIMFFFMPLIGLVHGMQPIVGFNYGANNLARVKEAVLKAGAFATAIATAAFLVLMGATRPVLSLFSRDPELLAQGVSILRMLVIFMPLVGFQMVGGSLFQALGKARPAFFLTLCRQVLFLIPLVLLLPRHFGLPGLWAAFPLADMLSAIVTGLWVAAEIRALDRIQPSPALSATH